MPEHHTHPATRRVRGVPLVQRGKQDKRGEVALFLSTSALLRDVEGVGGNGEYKLSVFPTQSYCEPKAV